MSTQDDGREMLQKIRFGFENQEHQRGEKWDAFYRLGIDFKTRHVDRGCVSTKRKFKFETLDEWENILIVVSDYETKNAILNTDYLLFPPVLEEWRAEILRKLLYSDRASYYCWDEITKIRDALIECGKHTSAYENTFNKLKVQAHINDPALPKRLFMSKGHEIAIRSIRTKTKYPEWLVVVPNNINKAKFLRKEIDNYMNWRKHNGSKS
tara:strand:+ start:18 stop:647 length:630 start_codon:yes stop_codon:yes gene_type:complete